MYIGVVGCMGVGKSTLTKALADRLGYRAYYEPVKENPYLDDFYADMKRYACIMQFFMLTQRYKQHMEIQALRDKDIGVVHDQIIFGDYIYGTLTHRMGFMDERDYHNYSSHFDTLRPTLRLPDVVIHLKTDLPTTIKRIQERGRESEKTIDPNYLQGLTDLFATWVDSVRDQTNVIDLDWNTFQPVEDVVKNIERQLNVQLPLLDPATMSLAPAAPAA
ncbi:MAG: deoxynucleoside kinase [Candidatus Kerfeldbacteria bacterium]|nr:deoxynucleoside kinase [Candidatus Kerfeldbacteria bacterium]